MTESSSRDDALALVIGECERRRRLYGALTPYPDEPPEVQQDKIVLLMQQWLMWKKDRVSFLRDMLWVPDPIGRFGGGRIDPRLAPPRMVPFMLYGPQKRHIEETLEILNHPEAMHLNVLKDRQVAETTLAVGIRWSRWLMDDGYTCLMTSYEQEVIDSGGKGNREGDTLFGRFRAYCDAMVWSLPHCAFNQQRSKRWVTEQVKKENRCLFDDSEDTKNKIVRPRWIVFDHEMFPGARGNYVRGAVPSDKLGKSHTFSDALMDEFGEYDKLGPGVDKKARDALVACCPHVQTQGTIPEGGGLASHFKELYDRGNTQTLRNTEIAWSDLPIYMLDAFFPCSSCGERSPYGKEAPGPGKDGIEKACARCGAVNLVTRDTVSSPWFERKKDEYGNDRVAIARYFQRKWIGAIGDRFFYTFREKDALVPRQHLGVVDMVDGFDPGHSDVYPAAFLATAYMPAEAKPRIVGYWMASGTHIEWWVPFFRRWNPRVLEVATTRWGAKAGRRWLDAFSYSEEALRMLAHLSRFPVGRIYGDTSGSKSMMTESPYEVLGAWSIDVNHRYTADREALVTRGTEWAGRMEIDPRIASLRPPNATKPGTYFPSILEVFESSKPLKLSQGEKVDVDAKDPPFVKNVCDAWFYACRAYGSLKDVMVDRVGADEFAVRQWEPDAGVVMWGEGA